MTPDKNASGIRAKAKNKMNLLKGTFKNCHSEVAGQKIRNLHAD